MQHHTIVCDPNEFDKEYNKWVKSINLANYQSFYKMNITHDGNYHYILYKININVPINKNRRDDLIR